MTSFSITSLGHTYHDNGRNDGRQVRQRAYRRLLRQRRLEEMNLKLASIVFAVVAKLAATEVLHLEAEHGAERQRNDEAEKQLYQARHQAATTSTAHV